MASQVVQRHLNHNWNFQAPLRQFTSLDVKLDLSRHFKLPLRIFNSLTTLRSFTCRPLITLRKAVKSTLRSYTYPRSNFT